MLPGRNLPSFRLKAFQAPGYNSLKLLNESLLRGRNLLSYLAETFKLSRRELSRFWTEASNPLLHYGTKPQKCLTVLRPFIFSVGSLQAFRIKFCQASGREFAKNSNKILELSLTVLAIRLAPLILRKTISIVFCYKKSNGHHAL